jgi:hypothetical protein
MQGRFSDAERLAGDALVAAESAGNWNGVTASRVQLAWCWKDIGRGAERAAEVERFVQQEVLTRPLSGGAAAVWNGNLALFMAEAGLEERALQYLARLGACEDTHLTQDVDGRSAAALGAEACALLRDEQLAGRLYKLLVPATACASSAGAASISEPPAKARSRRALRIAGSNLPATAARDLSNTVSPRALPPP